MVVGHACKAKQLRDLDVSDSEKSDKENTPVVLQLMPDSASNADPKPRLSAKCHREEGFKKLVCLVETSMEQQKDIQQHQVEVHQALVVEHQNANQEAHFGCEEMKAMHDELCLTCKSQEHTSLVLIDILKQSLL